MLEGNKKHDEAAASGSRHFPGGRPGGQDLLRAFARMRADGQVLCLVGGSEEKWSPFCRDLGILEHVRLIPRTEKVADYLQLFTLFVLPSLSESSPNTLLEAMSQGLIPVARDVGGVKEIWPQTGLDGLLFGPAPGDLTAALEVVFNAEEEQLLAWSGTALNQCREAFNQSVQARRLYGWYASLARC